MGGSPGLVSSLLSKLKRDQGESVRVLVTKSARYVRDLATARPFLAAATRVGRSPRTRGRPSIENLGTMLIGDDFQLVSRWVQSHLVTGARGTLEIGDDVNINFGAAISAHEHVRIGSNVRVGPWVIIMDSDYHSSADRSRASTAPIVIEDDVWLAARVTVVKGARIGKGSVIGANSVVAGEIPPGVVAAGVPARVIRRVDGAVPEAPAAGGPVSAELLPRVAAVLQRVFGFTGPVDAATRAEQVTGWDSLGQLRLVTALEEEFKVTFDPRLPGHLHQRGRHPAGAGAGSGVSQARLILQGEVQVGAGLCVGRGPLPVELHAGPGARIAVGEACRLEMGTTVFSTGTVRLGARVHCAPHVLIGEAPAGGGAPGSAGADIDIGDDVSLGARAVVLPGTTLAPGTVVFAGSVASGQVPPRSLVIGNPGRVEPRPLTAAEAAALHRALDEGTFVFDSVRLVAREAPGRVALRSGASELTYGALLARAEAIRDALESRGVAPGARVLLGCAEKDRFVAGFYGITLAGGVAVPLADGVSRGSVAEITQVSGATAAVTTRASAALMPDFFPGLEVLFAEECPAAAAPSFRAPPDLSAEAPALVLFTSGTTSRKKGVVLSHRALTTATRSINTFMRLDAEVREYVAVPLTHSFGLGRFRALFARAATLVVSDGLVNPPIIAAAMRAARCDGLAAVPAVVALFAGRYQPLLEELGARLRFVELGSAALPPEGRRRLMAAFPKARICMHYGLTEASRSAFIEFHGEADRLDTVGRASPGVQIEIHDEAGRPVPDGVEGEIVVRGGHVALGYLGDPERTQAVFRADGFHTGDYGVRLPGGYLKLLGRRDDMINSGGIKISPLELEAALRVAYPHLECCVLGLPDPAGVAGDVAAVVTVGAPALTLEALNRQLAESVDRQRLPRLVIDVAALPRTENGKVRRGELRQQLAARPG